MPQKQFMLDEHTPVTIYKRRSSRHLRLTIDQRGGARVSIPLWASYEHGLRFARSRLAWIHAQQVSPVVLVDGQAVGQTHHLHLLPAVGASRTTSRVVRHKIFVKYPSRLAANDPSVQSVAEAACVRALRKDAEQLLPARLAVLAEQYGYQYRQVSVKRLKSRWGSCDQHANIVLNLFLVQLPPECIDYVLLHELTHTQYLHHGADFWQHMRAVVPALPAIRKRMRTYQPRLHGPETASMP